jgi:hypothetical protein
MLVVLLCITSPGAKPTACATQLLWVLSAAANFWPPACPPSLPCLQYYFNALLQLKDEMSQLAERSGCSPMAAAATAPPDRLRQCRFPQTDRRNKTMHPPGLPNHTHPTDSACTCNEMHYKRKPESKQTAVEKQGVERSRKAGYY